MTTASQARTSARWGLPFLAALVAALAPATRGSLEFTEDEVDTMVEDFKQLRKSPA